MNILATVDFANQEKMHLVNEFFPSNLDAEIFNLFKQFYIGNPEWQEQAEYAHQQGRYVYQGKCEATDKLIDFASNNDGMTMMENIIGQAVEFRGYSLWADTAGYEITPHYDLAPFDVSIQIYMTDPVRNFEMMGTAVYEDGTDKLLFEIPYKRNSGYIMNTCHRIWHGLHHAIPPDYSRYSVYLRYKKVNK